MYCIYYIYCIWHILYYINYMASGSQKAECFSNRGDFSLPVFSQGFVSGSFFLTLLNPATNYFFFHFFCVRLSSLCFTCVSGLEAVKSVASFRTPHSRRSYAEVRNWMKTSPWAVRAVKTREKRRCNHHERFFRDVIIYRGLLVSAVFLMQQPMILFLN